MTKCQITCKSLQKSSKCQNFLRVWHLVISRADQLKKPPCSLLGPLSLSFSVLLIHKILDSRFSNRVWQSKYFRSDEQCIEKCSNERAHRSHTLFERVLPVLSQALFNIPFPERTAKQNRSIKVPLGLPCCKQ